MIFLLRLFTPSEWKKLATEHKFTFVLGFVFPIIGAFVFVLSSLSAYLNNFSDVNPSSEPLLKVQKIDGTFQLHLLHGFTNSENASGFVEPFKLKILDYKSGKVLGVFNTSGFVQLEIETGHIDKDMVFNQKNEFFSFAFEADKKYILRLEYHINDKRHFSSGQKSPTKLYYFKISKHKLAQILNLKEDSTLIKIYLDD